MKNKGWAALKKSIFWIPITITIVVAVVGWTLFTNKAPDVEQTVTDSENIIATIGQTGGDNTIVNNNLDIPLPEITIEPLEQKAQKNGQYITEFAMNVDIKVPIPNLYIQAEADSIVSVDVLSERSGIQISGQSGKRDGVAFTNITQVNGKYKLRVITDKAENINFTLAID